MTWLKHSSMKAKLYVLVAGIILPILAGTGLSIQRFYSFSQKNTEEIFEHFAYSISEAIGNQFWEEYNDIQTLSGSLNLATLTPQELQAKLNEEITRHENWDLVVLVDTRGNYLASNTFDGLGKSVNVSSLRSMNYADQVWFKSALAGKFSEAKTHHLSGTFVEDFIEDPLVKMTLSEARGTSGFTTVVKNSTGQVVGVLTSRVNSRWFEQPVLSHYQQIRKLYEGTEFTVLNKEGFVILDFDPTAQKSATEVQHDFANVLLKLNLVEKGVEAAALANAGKVGHGLSTHTRKKINQIVGYAPIKSDKFLSSFGWTVLVRQSESDALHSASTIAWTSFLILGVLVVFAAFGSAWYANNLARSIDMITDQVASASSQVASASEELTSSSEKLSSTSQQQAASIEETSASLTEISGMADSNVRSAENANQVAQEVNNLTTETQQWMSELSDAMKSIYDSNLRIEALVKIIEEIGEKTEVIDEIVFKTQLLSFNASVEAERAGEHGRGFAVVAQEVGNLAQMSGRAATEIASIVKNSIREADSVSKENKERVERGEYLTKETRIKMEAVIQRMTEILDSTNRIVLASKEQGESINQISENVESLNSATQNTASTAEQSASSSAELAAQSETLLSLVNRMKELVAGKNDYRETRRGGRVVPMGRPQSRAAIQKPDSLPNLKAAAGDDLWEKLS